MHNRYRCYFIHVIYRSCKLGLFFGGGGVDRNEAKIADHFVELNSKYRALRAWAMYSPGRTACLWKIYIKRAYYRWNDVNLKVVTLVIWSAISAPEFWTTTSSMNPFQPGRDNWPCKGLFYQGWAADVEAAAAAAAGISCRGLIVIKQ